MAEFMGFKNAVFLVAAYGVFWLGTFFYVFMLNQRQHNLEKDLEALEMLAKKDQ